MTFNSKLNEAIGSQVDSKFTFNEGDRVLLFLFEATNECLQEINLEGYEEEDSNECQFFVEENGEPITIACYFNLPQHNNKLKDYLGVPFSSWIMPNDEEFAKEFLKQNKNKLTIQPSGYDIKYPDMSNDEYYGDIYRKLDGKYIKLENKYEYEYGDDNFTAYVAIVDLVMAIYIKYESDDEYEIVQLGNEPTLRINDMNLLSF